MTIVLIFFHVEYPQIYIRVAGIKNRHDYTRKEWDVNHDNDKGHRHMYKSISASDVERIEMMPTSMNLRVSALSSSSSSSSPSVRNNRSKDVDVHLVYRGQRLKILDAA